MAGPIPPPEQNGVARHIRQNAVAYFMALALASYTEWKTEDRFTGRDGEKLEERVTAVERQVGTLPPADLLERVTRLEAATEYLRRDVERNGWHAPRNIK